jgi:biopolymer transport protein ExbD
MRRPPLSHLPKRAQSDDERVLPLINVVFLLLIFFMLAGQLASADPFRIEPPRSQSEGAGESAELTVLVGAEGQLALDGRELAAEVLQSAVAERLEAAPGTSVRMKADGAAEATQVVAVMERLRAAGVERLKLLTVPEDGR